VLVAGLGSVTDPTTPRGQVRDNAVAAVGGAILETRRQWADFKAALVERYGPQQATLIIGAITKDTPLDGLPGVPVLPGAPAIPGGVNIPGIPGLPGIPRP
jgi:hypothetical protein